MNTSIGQYSLNEKKPVEHLALPPLKLVEQKCWNTIINFDNTDLKMNKQHRANFFQTTGEGLALVAGSLSLKKLPALGEIGDFTNRKLDFPNFEK